MKVKILLFQYLLLILTIFVSCSKKSDNSDPKTSGFNYSGTYYKTSYGYIINHGSIDNSSNYEFQVVFSSNQLGYNYDQDVWSSDNGNSDLVTFIFTTSSVSNIEIGNYVWDLEETYNANTYSDVGVLLNWNVTNLTGTEIDLTGGGEVSVTSNTGNYNFDYELQLSNGEEISGSFSGDLKEIILNEKI